MYLIMFMIPKTQTPKYSSMRIAKNGAELKELHAAMAARAAAQVVADKREFPTRPDLRMDPPKIRVYQVYKDRKPQFLANWD